MDELRKRVVVDDPEDLECMVVLREELKGVPAELQKDVCREIAHDIGVMARTIRMMQGRE